MKKMQKQDFFKSLEKLENMAKAQICTGPNSEKTEWAGSKSENQTDPTDPTELIDYVAKSADSDEDDKETAKEIKDKMDKGQSLSKAEKAWLKAIDKIKKAEDEEKEDDKDEDKKDEMDKASMFDASYADKKKAIKKADDSEEDEDDEDDKDDDKNMDKSMSKSIRKSETIQEGIEASEFLAEVVKAFAGGLEGMEARISKKMNKSASDESAKLIKSFMGEQAKFNKSLAEAVANIGYGMTGALETADSIANSPARAPKSVQSMSKSQNDFSSMTKRQVLSYMEDLVQKGALGSLDVIKFESTGTLSNQAIEALNKSINRA